jgi:Cu+-exporting ATPase
MTPTTPAEPRTVELTVPGICCTECMQGVDIALRHAAGVADLRILGTAEKVRVTYDPDVTTPEDVVRAVERVGHPVQSWRPARGTTASATPPASSAPARPAPLPKEEIDKRRAALGLDTPLHAVRDHGFATLRLAFVGFVGLLALSEIAGESLGLFRSVEERIPAPVALAAAALGGFPIFRGAILGLRARQINTDLVMSVGILAAAASGEFIPAALIVFFVIAAHYLEELTVGRSRRAMQELVALVPRTARVKRAGGVGEEEVPVEALRAGDVVVVRTGERIPIDGRVATGQATVNQAAITGESIPVEKGPGAEVFAATVAEGGYLEVRVLAVGEDTTLGRIVQLVEEAEANKAPVQKFADRFSTVFLPIVLAVAGGTFLVTHHALAAVAVLVAACPCGVGLATPLSVVAAVGAGARRGLLIKGGLYLELLAKADTLLVDKTGTLTHGRPRVTDVVPWGAESTDALVALAAALEHYSEHPLARTVLDEAVRRTLTLAPAMDVELLPSRGLVGSVDGRALVLGTRRLLAERGIALSEADEGAMAALEAEGKTVLLLAGDGVLLGVLAAADTLRPEAPAALARVRALGVRRVVLLTGDNERVAAAVARQAGIAEVAANLLPEDKIATVRRLQGEGRRVIMVGDGINDAPALTQADIGIAMGVAGTDVALEAADVALMRDDWMEVPQAIELGRRTYRTIRQNIIFGIGFNVLVIGLAAVGLIGPVIAAASQAVPDIAVALNASRLLRSGRQDKESSTP